MGPVFAVLEVPQKHVYLLLFLLVHEIVPEVSLNRGDEFESLGFGVANFLLVRDAPRVLQRNCVTDLFVDLSVVAQYSRVYVQAVEIKLLLPVKLGYLVGQSSFSDELLEQIGSVQAVHAIAPDNSILQLDMLLLFVLRTRLNHQKPRLQDCVVADRVYLIHDRFLFAA